MKRVCRILILPALIAAALGAAVAASAQDGDKKLTLTVGLVPSIDSMNVAVGVTVPAFEAWNMQYAMLTDKASKDFATEPGLAESWEGSADKLTWTYKLRPNLKWSDGQPLTAEDIVYTINRSRDEAWLNHSATVENITASAPDPQTVVLKSKVPDPKLPTMDVYIVPKHIFSKYDDKELLKYRATDGVGSGPFVLEEWKKGQFWRMKANPNYWRGKPALTEVLFRQFNNPDAMVAALQRGEVDAIHDVPSAAFRRLQETTGIVALDGQQGGFTEFALNGGDGLKKPHPALLDERVREAIGHAIDKRTIVDRGLNGIARPADAMSPSASPEWIPEIPADIRFNFDLDEANRILDEAGYADTNGDGIREMPGGGRALRFVYARRSESQVDAPIFEFISGWLRDIGMAVTSKVYDDSQLTEVIGKGEYDFFVWGWTPFVDPEPMLNYFTCGQVSADPDDPTNYYNDANLCDPEYDKLYEQQRVELDHAKRVSIVHQMLTRFYQNGVYHVLYYEGDQQAYREDRFTGWIKQPADIGPVMFSNSSPSYFNLKPVSATSSGGGGGDGGGSAGIIALVVVGVLALGGAGYMLGRRRTADERE